MKKICFILFLFVFSFVCQAIAQDYYGYLYCHMSNKSETTLYALGTKADKGEIFHPLIGNQSVFDVEKVALIEGGTRDAFITRGRNNDYLMCCTDMCNRKSRTWFNYGIDLLHSYDMIHWSSVSVDFRKGPSVFSDPQSTDVIKDYSKIVRVWAPQVIWDKDYDNGRGGWLVYYSILTSEKGDYDKIYYSYANADFSTLTKPQLFYDKGISVIDCHIDWCEKDGLFHVFYKREGAAGVDRGIWAATFDKLPSSNWKDIYHITNEGKNQVEGPSAFRLIDEDTWKIAYIRYSGGKAYKVCNADAFINNVDSGKVIQGDILPQHGSFMTVTEDEYNMLEAWSDVYLKHQQTTDMVLKAKLEKVLSTTYRKNAVRRLLKLYNKNR